MFPLPTSTGPLPSSRDSLSISKLISDNGTLAMHYVLSRGSGTQAWTVVISVANCIEQTSTQVPAKVRMHNIIPGVILNPSNSDPFRWRKDGRIALRRVGGIQVLTDSIYTKTVPTT
jgi:hypothetical protein